MELQIKKRNVTFLIVLIAVVDLWLLLAGRHSGLPTLTKRPGILPMLTDATLVAVGIIIERRLRGTNRHRQIAFVVYVFTLALLLELELMILSLASAALGLR